MYYTSLYIFFVSFQSTPSAWRETKIVVSRSGRSHSHFNPLPPHGGRLSHRHAYGILITISIHSLRMEGDPFPVLLPAGKDISIHSLRMEGDYTVTSSISPLVLFQSTPSAWRETAASVIANNFDLIFQSTPSAWRETHVTVTVSSPSAHFNPLPPHGGRLAPSPLHTRIMALLFQSTPSAWRETCQRSLQCNFDHISIHSLRMEGDHLRRP